MRHHHYLRGGWVAHWLRRLVHLSGIFIVWIYYHYGTPFLVWVCLGIVLVLEILRLSRGWTIFGQRHYEKHCISAFAWGAIGMALVLLLAPGKAFAVPIIYAYAVGDPLLGELRSTRLHPLFVVLIGLLVISGIWWFSHLWLGTPAWLAFVMGPLTVAAEWPSLHWIDDNALMQLIPLLLVLIC
jgi:hypothetical protein